jgi:hypothetical protein
MEQVYTVGYGIGHCSAGLRRSCGLVVQTRVGVRRLVTGAPRTRRSHPQLQAVWSYKDLVANLASVELVGIGDVSGGIRCQGDRRVALLKRGSRWISVSGG